MNVLKNDNQIAGNDGQKIGDVSHFWVFLVEIQEVILNQIWDLVHIFVQIRDKYANNLVMIELIWGRNGGIDEKHVRDLNNVDFVDILSFEELD